MMIIANREKNVTTNLVFLLVMMESAQIIRTVTLMTKYAKNHANLIRIVLVTTDALMAIVCSLARMMTNVQTVNNIVTSKHKDTLNLSKVFDPNPFFIGKPNCVL